MCLLFLSLDGETKIDGSGRFREAFDDLEIALPWGLHSRDVTVQRRREEKSTKDLICHNHLHANHHSHPPSSIVQEEIKKLTVTLTGLWIDISRTQRSLGRQAGRLAGSLVKEVSFTLGNQIFGTTRVSVADLQTKIRLLLEVAFLVFVMGTFPSGRNASRW